MYVNIHVYNVYTDNVYVFAKTRSMLYIKVYYTTLF